VNPDRQDTPALRVDIQYFIEDLLAHSGMAAIRSSIRKLKGSSHPDERRSFERLVKIVQEGGQDRTLEGMNERAILMEDGLLYREGRSGYYVVPGSLIADQVLQDAATVPDVITVTTNSFSEDVGTVTVGNARIELKGNTWRVLKKLWEARGEFLSLKQLEPDPRNSLQRLREELKRHNCCHLIENEYGRGYRFIPRQ
jgi:DNA-binding response OmpR family regulator